MLSEKKQPGANKARNADLNDDRELAARSDSAYQSTGGFTPPHQNAVILAAYHKHTDQALMGGVDILVATPGW
jgi:hypothetical protein